MAQIRGGLSTQDAAGSLGRLLEKAVNEWLRDTQPCDLWQMCITCRHWGKEAQVCSKFHRVPPIGVICGSITCPAYTNDEEIPF